MVFKQYRRGLTLTELLVVVAILVAVTAILAPLLTSSMEGREVREAARQVNAYFQQARARAKELGRPVGVVIRRSEAADPNFDFGYQLSLAEEPPPYKGLSSLARARVLAQSEPTQRTALISDPGTGIVALRKFVQPNDQIRFNLRGDRYRVLRVRPATSTQIDANEANPPFAFQVVFETVGKQPINFATLNSVQFEVFRRPRSTSSTPLELPNGAALVMNLSGVGMDYVSEALAVNGDSQLDGVESPWASSPRQQYIGLLEFGRPGAEMNAAYANNPLTIMFNPNGGIDRIYRILPNANLVVDNTYLLARPKRPQDKVYLFVGKSGVDRWTNLNDGSNLWITIDPQTGLVSTAPNDLPQGSLASTTTPLERLRAVASSRQIAATGQSLGGQ